MPEISRFYGIRIRIYFRDHRAPHFHAVYGSYRIEVDIDSGDVRGRFPPRALRLVREWLALHRAELRVDWELAESGRLPLPIAPLE